MLTIQKEVYIQKNHQLSITIPKAIPCGKTEICLIFNLQKEPLIEAKGENQTHEFDRLKLFEQIIKNKNNKHNISKNIDLIKLANEVNNDFF